MLLFRLGEVDVHPAPQGLAVRAVGAHDVLEAGVFRVDGEVDADPAVPRAVEILEELDGFPGPEVPGVGLVLVKALNGAADVGLDAAGQGVFHGGLRLKIHVGIAGGAGGDHLQQGQLVAKPDVLRRQLVLDGHDFPEEPLLEAQVAAHAPEQHHGAVAVAVDKARQQQPAGQVLLPVIGGPGLFRPDVVDGIPVHAQIGVFQAAEASPPGGEDVAVFQQQLHKVVSSCFKWRL